MDSLDNVCEGDGTTLLYIIVIVIVKFSQNALRSQSKVLKLVTKSMLYLTERMLVLNGEVTHISTGELTLTEHLGAFYRGLSITFPLLPSQ